jgi:hypothetical protein
MAAAEQQVGTAAERADAILALNEGKYPKNCMMFDLGIVLHTRMLSSTELKVVCNKIWVNL